MRCNLFTAVPVFAALMMAACSENSSTPAVQSSAQASTASGPAEPVTGKTAYWAMYKSAYTWANDVVPLKLESKNLDMIAANEVGDGKGFEEEENELLVLWKGGRQELGRGLKITLARNLIALIADSLNKRSLG